MPSCALYSPGLSTQNPEVPKKLIWMPREKFIIKLQSKVISSEKNLAKRFKPIKLYWFSSIL